MFELKLKWQNLLIKRRLRRNKEKVSGQVRESSLFNVASISILKLLLLCIFGVIILFPFFLMISFSFFSQREAESLSNNFRILPSFDPSYFKIDNKDVLLTWSEGVKYNYMTAINNEGYWTAVGLTSLNVLLSVVLKVFITILMGYAFSLRNWRAKEFIWFCALALLVLPEVALLSGQYKVVRDTHMNETTVGFLFTIALPFVASIFNATMYKNAFESIPGRIKEVALVDGAVGAKYLFKIAIPMVTPTTWTIVILTAIASWNTYLWASIVVYGDSDSLKVVSVWLFKAGLVDYGQEQTTLQSIKMAGAILVNIPMFLAYFIFRKRIMNAVSRQGSTIKG